MELLERDPFDLVILDVILPRREGTLLLRRTRPRSPVAGVHLDIWACRARVGDRVVDLTPRELALEPLMRHPGAGAQPGRDPRWCLGTLDRAGTIVVNVCIKSVRRKRGADAIESSRGVGYRFRAG